MKPFDLTPRLVSPKMCAHLKALREQADPSEEVYGDAGHKAYRRTMRTVTDSYLKMVIELGMSKAKHVFGFDVEGLDYLQWAEYTVGCSLGIHTDTYPLLPGFTQRKLSFTLQLSSGADYDGGDLVLYPKPTEPLPGFALRALGSIIFFPAFTPHCVTPLTRGKRDAIVGWFKGPQWR